MTAFHPRNQEESRERQVTRRRAHLNLSGAFVISAPRSLVRGVRIPPQPPLLHPVTQGHLRSEQTPGGARGRPGRGAPALCPALTSHLLVTLSGLRGRCDRALSPSPFPPTALGIPEAGTSPVPVCHRCLLPDSRSLGRDPLHKLRPRSSGSTGTGRRRPRVLHPPEGPTPRGPHLPPGSRFTHRDPASLPVLRAPGRHP